MTGAEATVQSSSGIPERVLNAIRTVICADPAVTRVVLFGSRAKGTWRDGSDIDLAVYADGIDRLRVWPWLDSLDEPSFPWTVEVVTIDDATHIALRQHVERVGIELCGRSSR